MEFPFLKGATNALICSTCRKLLKDYNGPEECPTSSQSSSGPSSNTLSREYCSQSINYMNLDDNLAVLGNSPSDRNKLRNESYAIEKFDSAKKSLKDTFESAHGKTFRTNEEQDVNDYHEMLDSMITRFNAPDTSGVIRLQILTLLPNSYNVNKMCQVFGSSRRTTMLAVDLREEQGILATPQMKRGVSLAQTTVFCIQAFYEDDEYSRILPGKKDCISVKAKDGTRTNVQKRLLLNNIQELHQEFKLKYPDCNVEFSKFAELRPKYCILAGGTGTHTVCVCTHHQNVKLMLDGLNITESTRNWKNPASGQNAYKALLEKIICVEPQADCYHGSCKSCPGVDDLEIALMEELENRMIDNVTYKQWIATDRCTIEQLVKSSDEFVAALCVKLKKLLLHDYIAKQQNDYLKELKEKLKPGIFVATLDFSENYAFVVQEAAQAFHWSNNQATVHPMVIYYKDEENGEVQHTTLVGLSDCLIHDTIAIYMFQKKLIQFLKQKFLKVEKIVYYTDGAPQQYKNKQNFVNLLYHYRDFLVQAEWHFFATAHGKGACDGVGGTVKRMAARACLQFGSRRHILTPKELFDWASKNLRNLNFVFCQQEDYNASLNFLRDRFANAKTIIGTQSFHCFIPCDDCRVYVKTYSKSGALLCKKLL